METTIDGTFTVMVSRVDDGIGTRNHFKRFNQSFTTLAGAIKQAEHARLAIEHKYADDIAAELSNLMVVWATADEPYDNIWAQNDEFNPCMYINPNKPVGFPGGQVYYKRYAEGPIDYMITVVKKTA